jgi:hypothetical protein
MNIAILNWLLVQRLKFILREGGGGGEGRETRYNLLLILDCKFVKDMYDFYIFLWIFVRILKLNYTLQNKNKKTNLKGPIHS